MIKNSWWEEANFIMLCYMCLEMDVQEGWRKCLRWLLCSLWRDERITFFPVTLRTKRAILSFHVLRLVFSLPAWKNQYQSGLWNRNHKGWEQFEKNIGNRRDWLKISCWLIVFLSSNTAWAGIFINCAEFIHSAFYNKLLLCFLRRKETCK